MSKLSFRARALDAAKPMPVYRCEEIPDLPDFAAINRAVPQMPTGMEKEEECEHHLQRAISAQQAYGQTGDLVIPTPEVYEIDGDYERLYPPDYKIPRQLIHMQPFAMEQDIPDYDIDHEDEKWVNQQSKKMEISSIQFEEMMDRLEKGSGQHVVTLTEAKMLLKEDDDLIIAVYDYWLNKRLRTQHPLILQVKTEKRDGSTNNNPYVAFRRRTEKMQTRKNRKNDEASYEKMLKLRRDLSRAVTLLEMVKRREKTKREHLHLSIEIYEKRVQLGDYSGQLLAEVSAVKQTVKHAYATLSTCNQYGIGRQNEWTNKEEAGAPRKKREYKKRKHKQPQTHAHHHQSLAHYTDVDGYGDVLSSEDETLSPGVVPSDQEEESDPDGPFAFRRKKFCEYHAPILEKVTTSWPWCAPEDGGMGDKRYRYCLTSLSIPRSRCIGFARRRIGRGGRVVLDRGWTPLDDYWSELDSTLSRSVPNGMQAPNEFLTEVKNEWLRFRPKTPPPEEPEVETVQQGEEPCEPCESYEDPLSVGEFNVESFQTHQEELAAMHRRQLERLRQDDIPGASAGDPGGPPTALFTLDPASVEFAVSAVVNASQVQQAVSTYTNPSRTSTTINPTAGHGLTLGRLNCGVASTPLVNGPSLDNSNSVTIPVCPTPDIGNLNQAPLSPKTSCPTTPFSILATKPVTPQSATQLKIAQTAHGSHSVNSDNQEDKLPNRVKVESLVSENVFPMEVT